jgi:hypothetical protein
MQAPVAAPCALASAASDQPIGAFMPAQAVAMAKKIAEGVTRGTANAYTTEFSPETKLSHTRAQESPGETSDPCGHTKQCVMTAYRSWRPPQHGSSSPWKRVPTRNEDAQSMRSNGPADSCNTSPNPADTGDGTLQVPPCPEYGRTDMPTPTHCTNLTSLHVGGRRQQAAVTESQ